MKKRVVGFLMAAGCGGAAMESGGSPAAIELVDQGCLDHAHELAAAGAVFVGPAHASTGPAPIHVDATMIEGHRIAGEKHIHPDERTQRAIQKANVRSTAPSFKICLGVDGVPTEIVALRPSCFPRYDEHIKERMSEWRYSQYVVNGEAVAVCTAVTFVYKLE